MTLVSANEKPDSQSIIELSTVYFYKGHAPRVVALKDCDLLAKSSVHGAFSALYGRQSKQEGFMAARAYADQNRLQFTVVDFLVKLDQKRNPLVMKLDDLPQHDFITFQRVSRSIMDNLRAILKKRLEQDGADLSKVDLSKPHWLIMQRPELIASVIAEPGWEHLKVIAYPTQLPISEKPLNVGTVPFRHWDAIQAATCRLNPNIRITLDPPVQNNRDTLSDVPARPKDRHRSPRMK